MPRFSIVITTTRPRLVPHALRSALAQQHDDFEIIVSDNSDKGCRNLVESIAGARVRYFRPEGYLKVVPHWNFAFSQAQGDWQLLLCDDDAIVPDLLSVLDREITAHPEIDSVCWHYANFAAGDEESPSPGRLNVPGHTGQRFIRRSCDIIAKMFESGSGLGAQIKRDVPIAPASAYSSRVIAKVRGAWDGNLFLPICPMTTGSLGVLAFSDWTLRLDLPMTVLGQTSDSAAAHLKDATIYRRMNSDAFRFAPLKSMSIFPTVTLESLLAAQAALPPEQVGRYQVNWVRYFDTCYEAVEEIEALGIDAAELRAALSEAVQNVPPAVREAIGLLPRHATSSSPIRDLRKRLAAVSASLRARVGRNAPSDTSQSRSLDAASLGLHNVADCAGYLATLRS
jgi:hypothetical protein